MTVEAKSIPGADERRAAVMARLDGMGIQYELTEHPAVYTIEEMEKLGICEQGEVCKNLFLRDAKGKRHFLVFLRRDKRADLESISAQLGSTKLSFASAERLERFLGLSQGEVSPLGIINDTEAVVEVAFDRDLMANPRLGVHPNENTATVWISCDDLLRVIKANGNTVDPIKI